MLKPQQASGGLKVKKNYQKAEDFFVRIKNSLIFAQLLRKTSPRSYKKATRSGSSVG
jgi:hypothetical protein